MTREQEQKTEKIVDIAKREFIEQGINETTIMDIVAKAEMERKTFYNYFADKEEIADYIYFLCLRSFYSTGFVKGNFVGLPNGFEKIKRYYTTIVERFVTYSEDILYMVHYDYFFRKNHDPQMIKEIYQEFGIHPPVEMMKEGIEDGSIDIGEDDPECRFQLIDQSLGSFAFRLLLRGYQKGIENNDVDFTMLYELLEMHLELLHRTTQEECV